MLIVFPLEGRPLVVAAWDTDADDARITEWFDARPDYARLIHEAIELSGEAA